VVGQVTVRARHLNHPGGRQDIRSILDLGSRAPRFRRQAHAFGAPLGEIDRCTLAIRGSVARRGIGTQPNAMSGTRAFRQSQKNPVHPRKSLQSRPVARQHIRSILTSAAGRQRFHHEQELFGGPFRDKIFRDGAVGFGITVFVTSTGDSVLRPYASTSSLADRNAISVTMSSSCFVSD